ncbi:MAG: kynureninase, partial [Flavobacteriaceae bacterium]
MIKLENSLSFAKQLDQEDNLSDYRNLFHIPKDTNKEELIYFCGNSLGLQPKSTKSFIDKEMEDWANLGVRG